MDARRQLFFLLLLACLHCCGCMAPDPSVELLEGELRWMENQLYMLEDELQQKCDQLADCRANIGSGCAPDVTESPLLAPPRTRVGSQPDSPMMT